MACECERRDGLHVFEDLFLVEVVRHGAPVADGELGRILVTDLGNHAMPLIRYDIGDAGRLVRERCPCGRTSARLFVEGRVQDVIVTGDGGIVTNDQIMDFIYARGDVDEFQLTERTPGRFELLVVPAPGAVTSSRVDHDVLALLGPGATVKRFDVRSIEPESSGKFRFVRSATFDRFG
ncbi:MAG: hypothetical protein CMJ18_28255 [Phycisphaeraceae bacterium]|nr:hypothetical protein [Phycisphaeraceae bacterium]